MELFGIAIILLAAILIYVAWSNDRWMKLAHQDTLELLKKMDARLEKMDAMLLKMDDTLREIAKLIVAEGERTRQVLRPS